MVLRDKFKQKTFCYGPFLEPPPFVLPDDSSLLLDSPWIAALSLEKSVRNAFAVRYKIASPSRDAFSCQVSFIVISEYSADSYN